jgi:Rad52/22 family double-strand break repair protein
MELKNQIEEVNAILLKGEPHNISVDSFSGFTGYKPMYLIDAMNEVFAIGDWGFEEISSEIVTTPDDKLLAVAQVRVMLKDVAFQPTGWGQARVTKGDLGDARKGAQTDAIKKALSYFSIGNRAYRGLLEAPAEKPKGKPQPQKPQPVKPVPSLAFVKARVQAKGLATNKEQWATWKLGVLGQPVSDEVLTQQQIEQLMEAAA